LKLVEPPADAGRTHPAAVAPRGEIDIGLLDEKSGLLFKVRAGW